LCTLAVRYSQERGFKQEAIAMSNSVPLVDQALSSALGVPDKASQTAALKNEQGIALIDIKQKAIILQVLRDYCNGQVRGGTQEVTCNRTLAKQFHGSFYVCRAPEATVGMKRCEMRRTLKDLWNRRPGEDLSPLSPSPRRAPATHSRLAAMRAHSCEFLCPRYRPSVLGTAPRREQTTPLVLSKSLK